MNEGLRVEGLASEHLGRKVSRFGKQYPATFLSQDLAPLLRLHGGKVLYRRDGRRLLRKRRGGRGDIGLRKGGCGSGIRCRRRGLCSKVIPGLELAGWVVRNRSLGIYSSEGPRHLIRMLVLDAVFEYVLSISSVIPSASPARGQTNVCSPGQVD